LTKFVAEAVSDTANMYSRKQFNAKSSRQREKRKNVRNVGGVYEKKDSLEDTGGY